MIVVLAASLQLSVIVSLHKSDHVSVLSCSDEQVIRFTRLRRKPWLPVLRSSLLRRMDQAVEACGRVSSEAFAKEDMHRRIPPKIPKGPRP
jgi:hypothetical protein